MSFSRSHQPLYSMLKIYGLLPFRLEFGKSGEILGQHIKFLDFICSSIIILIFAIILYIDSKSLMSAYGKIHNVGRYGSVVFRLMRYNFKIIFIISNIINRKRFANVLIKFDQFDEQVIFKTCNTFKSIAIHYEFQSTF